MKYEPKLRSRSVGPIGQKSRRISSELRKIEKREKSRENPVRNLEHQKFGKEINENSDKIKVNVDKAKKEISMTLSPQLELETIANLGTKTPKKKVNFKKNIFYSSFLEKSENFWNFTNISDKFGQFLEKNAPENSKQ